MGFDEEVASRHQEIVTWIDEALQRDEPYVRAVFAKMHNESFGIGSPAPASLYALSSLDVERFFYEFRRRCTDMRFLID